MRTIEHSSITNALFLVLELCFPYGHSRARRNVIPKLKFASKGSLAGSRFYVNVAGRRFLPSSSAGIRLGRVLVVARCVAFFQFPPGLF